MYNKKYYNIIYRQHKFYTSEPESQHFTVRFYLYIAIKKNLSIGTASLVG